MSNLPETATLMPPYVEVRLRQALPFTSDVIPTSTPVIAFGDPRTAHVATVGINPSRREFLDASGTSVLRDTERRLETLISLGTPVLATASYASIAHTWTRCNDYFRHNPNTPWFTQLEDIFAPLGASYAAGSACHLDLVQGATNPTWGNLSAKKRQSLLTTDRPFLQQQLEDPAHIFRYVLLNGKGVIDQFRMLRGVTLVEDATTVSDGGCTTRFVVGVAPGNRHVIGWSTNIQSASGVTKGLRHRIRERVALLASAGVANLP